MTFQDSKTMELREDESFSHKTGCDNGCEKRFSLLFFSIACLDLSLMVEVLFTVWTVAQ